MIFPRTLRRAAAPAKNESSRFLDTRGKLRYTFSVAIAKIQAGVRPWENIMSTRSKLSGFCLAALAAALFAGRAPAASGAISFVDIPDSGNPVAKLAEGANAPSVLAVETEDGWRFVVKGLPKACSAGPAKPGDKDFFASYNRPVKFGTFQLPDGKGVFMSAVSGGSGASDTVLMAVNPRKCAAIAMDMQFSAQATEPIPDITYTTNWNSPVLGPERAFLAASASEFGYVTADDLKKQKTNPRYAWYFWKMENSARDGKLILHWYKGKPVGVGSEEVAVQSSTVTYTGWFKSGVTAYDSVKDEFHPLFHPKSRDCWPSALKLYGDYLLIGTRGEGLAIINLKTSVYRRINPGQEASYVESLSVKNDEIIVNKTVKVPFPKF